MGLARPMSRGKVDRLVDTGFDVESDFKHVRLVLIASRRLLRESFAYLLHTRLPGVSVESYERVEDMAAGSAGLVLISQEIKNGRNGSAAFADMFWAASEICGQPPIGVLVEGYDRAFVRSLFGLGAVGIVELGASAEVALAAVKLMITGWRCFPRDTVNKLPTAPPSAIVAAKRAPVAAPPLTADSKMLKALELSYDTGTKERRTGLNTLRATVEKEVEKLLSRGKAEQNSVARALGMSARTFSRRLALEETTYQEVVDQLRRSLALQHLRDPCKSVSQISWLLGYESSSSFNHAFRRWTGSSPSVARKGLPTPFSRPDSGFDSRDVRPMQAAQEWEDWHAVMGPCAADI